MESYHQESILIVGGGKEAVEGIRLAREAGYRVIVSDQDPTAPGLKWAHGFVQASVYDPEETRQAVFSFEGHRSIKAVLALACDAPRTVATVAHALGLPGHSLSAAQLATDKLAMKTRFRERGIPTPWFVEIRNLQQLQRCMEGHQHTFVLKPVDSRGGRGVVRIGHDADQTFLDWAISHSLSQSPSRRLILEEWVEGPQLSTESVVWDEDSVLVAVADRNYDQLDRLQPFVIENGGNTPSRFNSTLNKELDRVVRHSAHALGIRRGTVKGDIVLGDSGPQVIEIAARLSGGYFCTHTIPEVYGVNLVETALQIASGKRPDLATLSSCFPRCHQGNRYLFLPQGRVRSIHCLEEARALPGVSLLELFVKPGDNTRRVSDHTLRSGVVITYADTREEAVRVAEAALRILEIRMETR